MYLKLSKKFVLSVMVLVGVKLRALLHATLVFCGMGVDMFFTLRHTDSSWWIPPLLIGAGLCRLADLC